MQHKNLVRQVRRAFGVANEKALKDRLDGLRERGDGALADSIEALFAATEQSYLQYDRDLMVRKRMLEISSDDLMSANDQLRSEAARQRQVLVSLQNSVQRLTYGADATPDAPRPPDFDNDLLRLTHALEELVKQRETARAALAATEATNRRILNSLREVVFQTDLQGRWVYLNPAWTTITGFSVSSSLGQRAVTYMHLEDQQANRAHLRALMSRGQVDFRQQMRYRTASGGYRWLEVYASRIDDESGQMAGVTGSLIDITEQKLAKDQLIISEERLNQALLATNSRLWDWDMGQSQPYVDPGWMANLGYTMDDPALAGMAWQQQMHPEDLPRWRAHLREHLLHERMELDIELRFMTAKGDWRYACLRGKVIAWDDNKAVRMAGMLQDISPRKEAEAAALRQQELTEQILDQLPIPVFLKDRAGRFLRFNRQFQEFSQRSREQMLGQTIDNFASRGWAAATQAEDMLAWTSGQMVTTERRLTSINPPLDMLVNRIVITSGGQSYLLGFSIDISEQRAARDAMQRAVESAEAASRAKSEFLANMSHEIRTPMNGILGMTELVLESKLTDEQREDLALVKASADALLTIINDILDFSKIEAGKLDIEEVPFDLRKLVTESARSMALRAQQKSLELVCDLPASLPRTMKGDPGRLRQVLINLLGNAIKFTQHGRIVLEVRRGAEDGDRCDISFSVRDTGIGIPPEKQKLIFEAFSQVDGSTTRQYGGTGLGLTICRRLVILMQGQIAVKSEPGKGSEFSFTVPLRMTGVSLQATLPPSWLAGKTVLLADPGASRRENSVAMLSAAGMLVTECAGGAEALSLLANGPRPDLLLVDADCPDLAVFSPERMPARPPMMLLGEAGAMVVDACMARPFTSEALLEQVLALLAQERDDAIVFVSDVTSQGTAPLAAPVQAGSGQSGMNVLLAEDNPVNQRLALRLLEKMGHRITLVDNGLAALEAVSRTAFDVILMDVQMPGLDGLAATRHIRQRETVHGGHVPIIAMTARAMQGDRERCLEAGMDDYLSKPIDASRLRQMMAQFDTDALDPVLAWRGALLRLDGDTDLLLELAAIFLDDGPSLLAELRDAINSGDGATSERAVHSLKGVLVNFGAQRALGVAERLSASLHQTTQREQWRVIADELAPILDEVYAALRKLIADGPAAMHA